MNNRLLIVALVLVLGVGAMSWHVARQMKPDVNLVAVGGDLEPRQKARVLETLLANRSRINRVSDVNELLGALPWIHHVEIMRRWPDRLVITVVKEVPIAYWNDDAFINGDGHAFESDYVTLGSLAQLYGPKDSERLVMQQYQALAKALSRVGQGIETLSLDDRGSWEFETDTGIHVMLGKEDMMDRIQRFLYVAESVGLLSRLHEIEEVDTRYANGVAVRWTGDAGRLAVATTDNGKRETKL